MAAHALPGNARRHIQRFLVHIRIQLKAHRQLRRAVQLGQGLIGSELAAKHEKVHRGRRSRQRKNHQKHRQPDGELLLFGRLALRLLAAVGRNRVRLLPALLRLADQEDDQNENAENQDRQNRPDPPDVEHRDDGNLRLLAGNVEGQVAAEGIRVRLLPAAVLPDENGQMSCRLTRREIMHGMRRSAVRRNRDLPLLDDLFRNRRGEPGIPRIDRHIVSNRVRQPRTDRRQAGVCLRHGLRGKLCVVVIAAVDKEDRSSAVPADLAGNGCDIAGVDGRDRRVKVQVIQLRHVPRAVVAVLLRDFRVNIRVKAVAIVKALGFEHCIVRDVFQRHLPHLIGNRRHIQKLFVRNRLCLAGLAHGIQARKRIRDKIVFRKVTRIAAGDRTGKLRRVCNFHHAAAAGDRAGRTGYRLLRARADNAADVFGARKRALGVALPHSRTGLPGNAADVVAGIARDTAKAAAICNQTQIHTAADAARVAAFGLNNTFVCAVLNDGLELVLALIVCRKIARHVVLGVVAVLNRHRARNAADADIAVYIGGIPAVVHLAECDQVNVNGRRIGYHIARIARRVGNCRLEGIGDLAEFLVDLAHIVRQLPDRAGDRAIEAADLAGKATDGRVEVSKIGRSHDLRIARE